MMWTDELIKADFSKEVTSDIPIPISLIWSPQLSIYNTVTEETVLKTSEDKYQTVFLSPNGTIRLSTVGLSETKCDANILYYPMDVQRCEIHFISNELIENVVLRPNSEENLVSNVPQVLIKNEEWEITDVKCDTNILYGVSRMVLSFTMSRHPMYLFMNFAFPLAYLCFLNFFVFLLPESSGERISYAVTMLLALILYLNMIADRLPNTIPVSLLNINVVIQLSSSSCVVWMTILTLWMYEKQQKDLPVSWGWQAFVRITTPKSCRRSQRKIRPLEEEVKGRDDKVMEDNSSQGTPENEETITWMDVTNAANRSIFWIAIMFLIIQCFLFVFLIIVRPI
ncbi:acetylcholine receptor subunit delta-like [Saccostrea echinata]|uniref:acetylcholine receptor subunit delta-like n=1 Tax=Saccostrea echinata TaxID=191078 RepID=UPI002A84175D|nr:acetylcholine receptor subunit delta-like [Saccostrea echinata]